MDLQKLLSDDIITQDTYEWLVPLWQKELDDIAEIQNACANGADLFGVNNEGLNGVDDDNNTESDILLMVSKNTIQNLHGISFSFYTDSRCTGHGDRVWHASIAICLYLKQFLHQMSLRTFRSLELGAGTALPSLFLGQLVAAMRNSTAPISMTKPFIHITDASQYRNIRQILLSLSRQDKEVLSSSSFRVSPHNWGQGIEETDSFISFWTQSTRKRYQDVEDNDDDQVDSEHNNYDLIIVSDCIYNPKHHHALLKTIAATLRFPACDTTPHAGGKAILSFSLHGNAPDQDIWNFVDKTIPSTRSGGWHLVALPVQDGGVLENQETRQPVPGRHGWDLEQIMQDFGIWTAHFDRKRWFSYLYVISWTRHQCVEANNTR